MSRVAYVPVVLLALAVGCGKAPDAAAPTGSDKPSASPASATAPDGESAGAPRADEERGGAVKAPPTVRVKETDEFGLVVDAARKGGAVIVTVDRVDSLTGAQAERAAAAHGDSSNGGVPNDHYEVNDNSKTREYVLAPQPDIWRANPSDVGSPKPLTVDEWLTYVTSPQGRAALFHFDVEGSRVIAVEEQYYP